MRWSEKPNDLGPMDKGLIRKGGIREGTDVNVVMLYVGIKHARPEVGV